MTKGHFMIIVVEQGTDKVRVQVADVRAYMRANPAAVILAAWPVR